MGWKSSKQISRNEAILLITERALSASNEELELALVNLGFGDDMNLPHYGYNFSVVDKVKAEEEDEDQ